MCARVYAGEYFCVESKDIWLKEGYWSLVVVGFVCSLRNRFLRNFALGVRCRVDQEY